MDPAYTYDDCCRACYKGDLPHGTYDGTVHCGRCHAKIATWSYQEAVECHRCGAIRHLDPLCPDCGGRGHSPEGWPCRTCEGDGRLIW